MGCVSIQQNIFVYPIEYLHKNEYSASALMLQFNIKTNSKQENVLNFKMFFLNSWGKQIESNVLVVDIVVFFPPVDQQNLFHSLENIIMRIIIVPNVNFRALRNIYYFSIHLKVQEKWWLIKTNIPFSICFSISLCSSSSSVSLHVPHLFIFCYDSSWEKTLMWIV